MPYAEIEQTGCYQENKRRVSSTAFWDRQHDCEGQDRPGSLCREGVFLVVDSPVTFSGREAPHKQRFCFSLRIMQKIEDWLAERGEFELSGDFISGQ